MKKSHNRKKVKTSRRRFIKHDIVTNFPVPQMGAPPKPHQDIKDRLNVIFAGKQQAVQQDEQSCVLCKKGQISSEYELCSSCEKAVIPMTPLWDMPIKNMSAMDSLKGMFETNILLMIKKGSYHGKPAFQQLRQIASNYPNPLRKHFANAIVRIYMYKVYRLVNMVLKENQYPQFNGPVAPINTPADMTNAIEQFDNLINQMNLQFNNMDNQTDEQIINFMKGFILDDAKYKLKIPSEQLTEYKSNILGLLHYIHGGQHITKLGIDAQEYTKALVHSGVLTKPQLPKKGFFNVFKK